MNIGLLAAPELNGFRIATLEPILTDPDFCIQVVVIDDRPQPSLRKRLLQNLKKGRGGYILIMALQWAFARKEPTEATANWCRERGIAVLRTTTPYAPATLERIRSYDLDVLVLVGGYGIVRQPLLDLTPIGVLSYHHGDMRYFRGMPPALWELYHGAPEMGVTVQILSPGIDDGIPLVERHFPIHQRDTVAQLEKRALTVSIPMLYEALRIVSDPSFVRRPLDQLGPVYTLPDLRQWLRLQWRMGLRKLGLRYRLRYSHPLTSAAAVAAIQTHDPERRIV